MNKVIAFLMALVAVSFAAPADTMAKVINSEWQSCKQIQLFGGMLPDLIEVSKVASITFEKDIITVVFKGDAKGKSDYAKIIGVPRAVLITTSKKDGTKNLAAIFEGSASVVTGSPAVLSALLSTKVNALPDTAADAKDLNLVGFIGAIPVPVVYVKNASFKMSITDGLLEATGADKEGNTSRLLAVAGLVRVDQVDNLEKKASSVNGIWQSTSKLPF